MLPRNLKIGHVRYKTEVVPVKKWDEGDSTLGCCDPNARLIKIKAGQQPLDTKETFVHELLHAIWKDRIESTALGTLLATADRDVILYQLEEIIVEQLAPALLIMFRENPKVLQVIEEYIEEYGR